MDAGLFAFFAGAGGVAVGKIFDIAVARVKAKPAELSFMAKQSEGIAANILQQRQQFDDATSKFRAELQQQIDDLQKDVIVLTEENKKYRNENIALTFKIAELEYRLKIGKFDGSFLRTPTAVTTEVTTKTTAVVEPEKDDIHEDKSNSS